MIFFLHLITLSHLLHFRVIFNSYLEVSHFQEKITTAPPGKFLPSPEKKSADAHG
jgi:hypothetical protein